MAANVSCDDELSKLKSQIQSVLRSQSDGIESGSFWNHFIKKHCSLPNPKNFKVLKRSDLLELCSDVIEVTGSGNTAILSLKKTPAPTDAASDRRGGDAKHTRLAAANEKTPKTESLTPASKKKTSKVESSSDSSSKPAVENLELKQLEMQPNSQASFYDKFYGASPSQLSVSAAGSHQKDNVAKANTSLPNVRQSEDFVKGHHVHGAGDVSGVPPAPGLLGSGNAAILMGIRPMGVRPNVPSVYSNRGQSGTAIHQSFSVSPLTVMSAQTAVGSKDLSSSPNMVESWQQLTQNAMYHKVNNQPPVVRYGAISINNVTSDTSYRSSSKVSATGGRKMNFSRQQINGAAEDCIDRLSAAKDYVSLEKIEKLLLQHFEVESLQQLHLYHLEELSCVNDLVRMVCKVNLYIQNFIKVGHHLILL